MNNEIQQTIAQYGERTKVGRELHDVPPYRVYEVRLDGRRAVLKIDDQLRGHAADEGRVHEYVAQNTAATVPEVIAVGNDHYITEWVDEIAQSPGTVDAEWARVAGQWLATLHEETASEFDGFGRPRDGHTSLELEAYDDWSDAVIERITYHRPFLESVGYAEVADAVKQFVQTHPDVFDGAGEPVLCHGDVHPEHVVRLDGETASTIDFEHALVAPREYDYWRTAIPYLEGPDHVEESVLRAFREGYESVGSLPDDLESRRPFYFVVNLVAFLESLHLQQTVGLGERKKRSERIRTVAFETLEKLTDRSK